METKRLYIRRGKRRGGILAALLAVCVLLATIPLSGCDDDGDPNETSDTAATTADPEPITHKVGFVYSGPVEGSTHNLIWENARGQLERNLITIETFYVDNVFVSNYNEAVGMLIERGATVIVSTHHLFSAATEKAAKDNKELKFISFGGETTLFNLAVFQPLLYQPAHVTGLAASYNNLSGPIGIVADTAMYNHAGVVNGYIQGAKIDHGPNLSVHLNYVSSDEPENVKAAIDDLRGKGINTIMLYLSTDYGIRYCESVGVKVVAYSGNLPDLAPNNYISGFYFNVNSYLTEQVRFIQNDFFFPTTTLGSLESGHVRMIQLSSNENSVNVNTAPLVNLLYDRTFANDRVFVGEIRDNFGTIQVEQGVVITGKDVIAVEWIDAAVGGNIGRFSVPRTEIPFVPLVVRGGWNNGQSPWVTAASTEASATDSPAPTTEATTSATPEPTEVGTPLPWSSLTSESGGLPETPGDTSETSEPAA